MIDALPAALNTALNGAETDLELQMRLLAGTAGDYGQALLITAADCVLRSHLWPVLTPRTPQVNVRRERIGVTDAGELTVHMYLDRPGTLWLSLCRKVGWLPTEYLRAVHIAMDGALWEQIRETR